jgi:hypothetical protein
MNYYKILMNLHRKTTAINMSFALPLHSTYHKATQSIGWEPVATTNHIERYLEGLDVNYATTTENRRIRWSIPVLKFG